MPSIKKQGSKRTMKQSEQTKLGRKPKYKKEDPKKTITISITTSRHTKIRTYAFQHETTISDLIGEFIDSLEK